ncbi:formate dehydrogenase accessory sulfurtransferase FdhD [Stakelama sediminis]|uniref:Sulfur carrier protein FdhD n=1 Tax=Stakelama sediminis TaxID=463200 RepID=A0A840YUH0_9SPHN|nr:FdhD protein [Stakelama sediminis]
MTGSREEQLVRLTRDDSLHETRSIAVETPVAIEFNGIGYAVMMMTPAHLHNFALGFALTERIARDAADILDIDIAKVTAGTILRIQLAPEAAKRIGERVRHRTSDTGCGLCGIASLESLTRPLPPPPEPTAIDRDAIFAALEKTRAYQPLNQETGATHAAFWCNSNGDVQHSAEDVGRHNALDKLIGMIGGMAPKDGFCLITSRISFEMADKALVARMGLLVGISAPTSMAVDHARTHGLGLVALARNDSMLVLNDPLG